jgi:hypothetical protein
MEVPIATKEDISMAHEIKPIRVEGMTDCPLCQSRDTVSLSLGDPAKLSADDSCVTWCSCGNVFAGLEHKINVYNFCPE